MNPASENREAHEGAEAAVTNEANDELPIWRREALFPAKPVESPYGVFIGRRQVQVFQSIEALGEWIRDPKNPAALIWSPERPNLFPPEEAPSLLAPLKARKLELAQLNWIRYRNQAALFLLPLIYGLFQTGFNLRSQSTGFMAVLWLMFGGIPAYEAWKSTRRAARLSQENLDSEAQEVRFEIWLRRQAIPYTKVLLGMLIGVYLVQVLVAMKADAHWLSAVLAPIITTPQVQLAGLAEAGLVKAGGYLAGQFWRLFTAPFLHGNLLHLVMNGLALHYLGRRAEVMARWPHLLLVYLFSCLAGGIASAHGLPEPSVGASGGILGVLGFLLVFEFLHGRLVPKPATRRLIAGIVLTMVIGFVGYQFIDNWAHGGGLLAGMLYGMVVFPPSSSPHRPHPTRVDLIFGALAALLLIASAIFAVAKMKALMP